jgi:hypothetical protein
MVTATVLAPHARAEPQTRIYDRDGRSIGTAVPSSDGSALATTSCVVGAFC